MSDDDDGQRRLARLATVSALLVIASFLAAKAARDATLLTRFSIKSLPLFIGISAALSLPIIILAGKLMVRFGPMRLVPAMNAVSGLFALGEWILIARYPRPVAVLTFFHLNIASAVLVSGFWSMVNERFDIASAKRHIGRIGMGATFGGILGGVVAERTAVYLAPDAILGVLAVMQLGCAAILFIFGRGQDPKASEQADHEAMSTWSAMGGVIRSSLLRKAGIVVVVTAIGAGALDYVFKADIVGNGTRADLLRQLAVFYTVTNIITAVVQVACTGPILTALGVPRSVSTLPYMLTGFSMLSAIVPLPVTATLARGAELVTRNSIYRAGYELLYAPLPTEQKRPTKVVLDVGADKVGDMLSAQLVGVVVFLVAAPRTGLLITAALAGLVGIIYTLRLPRAYTESLEASLLEAVAEHSPAGATLVASQPEPWVSLTDMPAFGHPADVVPLRLRRRRKPRAPRQAEHEPLAPPGDARIQDGLEHIVRLTRTFRGGDAAAIRAALGQPLPYEVVPIALELVAHDDDEIAKAALIGLRTLAPLGTGIHVEALVDQGTAEKLRRRIPGILVAGSPALAGWGLWRGLSDPSFDVRYYCSTVLAGLEHGLSLRQDDVFEYVRKELLITPDEWRARKLTADPVIEATLDADLGLAHIFRVLGLVLPAEPLRVALHAVQTEDPGLRGMALEYLESILPTDVRAQLWPFLDDQAVPKELASVDPAASASLLERLRAATSGELPKLAK